MTFREATSIDVRAMEQCRMEDPEAGEADRRMAAYLDGRHHPGQALAPRVAYVAEVEGRVVGYIAGHLTRRYSCGGELQVSLRRAQLSSRGRGVESGSAAGTLVLGATGAEGLRERRKRLGRRVLS